MQTAFVLLIVVAVVAATPAKEEVIALVSRSEVRDDLGQFAVQYKTAHGITNTEQGALIPSDDGRDVVLVKQGSFGYTSPEGTPYMVTWTAGKDGFKAEGHHLPVSVTKTTI